MDFLVYSRSLIMRTVHLPAHLLTAITMPMPKSPFSNVVSVFSVMPSHILATRSCVCKVQMKDKDSECQEQAKRSSTSQTNCTYFHVSKSKLFSWITEPFDSRLPVQLA